MREAKAGWEEVALPPGLQASAGHQWMLRLGASGDDVVLTGAQFEPDVGLLPGHIHIRHAGTWRTVPAPEKASSHGPAHQLVFDRDRWLLGYAQGEWGGALWAVPFVGEPKRIAPEGDRPLTGVAKAADGRVFAATAADDGWRASELGYFDPDRAWHVLARCDSFEPKRNTRWNLDSDSIAGIALDAHSNVHAVLHRQGLVRWEKDKLVVETPGWASADHGPWPNGLIVDGDLAVISTSDSGVLVWKLGTRDARRIPIPVPTAPAPPPPP